MGNVDGSEFEDLLPVLQWLDRLLERAIASAQVLYGPEAATDPYRGLHIDAEDAERLLTQTPGIPRFHGNEIAAAEFCDNWPPDTSRLAWLQQAFELSTFDLDVIAIALAPELDRRYERLYAYLQDDVRCKRPSVDLALNLLSASAGEKVARRAHFAPNAPLLSHDLLHLVPDPHQVEPSLLSYLLKLDEQIVHFLLGQAGLDWRLASFCRVVEPTVAGTEPTLSDAMKRALPTLITQAKKTDQSLQLYFCGPSRQEKRRAAAMLAGEVGVSLLVTDLAQALEDKAHFDQNLKLLIREAWLQDAILYLEGLDVLRRPEHEGAYRHLLEQLPQATGMLILSSAQPWGPPESGPTGVMTIAFPRLDFVQRQLCWQTTLATAGVELDEEALIQLANGFRLTACQIENAVAIACNQAMWRTGVQGPDKPLQLYPTLEDLFAAARAQSGHELVTLARKIEPNYCWDDIVLPPDPLAQLHEICNQAKYQHVVYHQWQFGRKLSTGKGLNVLFSGPPGTGKTMAAEVIAQELQLDLYKIDLSQVVSKYIGETEKNLDRIFKAAETANAILLFDEADALFGKRSEVRDAHDRYANIEVGYLLQKMEEYEGVAILATNLRQNLDEAFVRRLAFTVHFPAPDAAHRHRIWVGIWPPQVPLAQEVNFDVLARQFKLNGGNIKNIALAASFLAAAERGSVTMDHLLQATRREYQKMGKVLSEAEISRWTAAKHSSYSDFHDSTPQAQG